MNFREAMIALTEGKQVRRPSWRTDVRITMTDHGIFWCYGHAVVGPSHYCVRHGEEPHLYWDHKAIDWVLYEDPDYRFDHDWNWALKQMKNNKKVCLGHAAHLSYQLFDGRFLCCNTNIPNSMKYIQGVHMNHLTATNWALYKDKK